MIPDCCVNYQVYGNELDRMPVLYIYKEGALVSSIIQPETMIQLLTLTVAVKFWMCVFNNTEIILYLEHSDLIEIYKYG